MPCLFALFAAFIPRVADVILWIARPAMFTTAFKGSWFLPLLGIIFLPFTTLFYVILYTPGIGLSGWDWLWIITAVIVDIAHWGHTSYTNKEAIPGYKPPAPPAPPVGSSTH